jgi:hypothetical protein
MKESKIIHGNGLANLKQLNTNDLKYNPKFDIII